MSSGSGQPTEVPASAPELLAQLETVDLGTLTAATPAAGDHLLFGDATDSGKLKRQDLSAAIAAILAAADAQSVADELAGTNLALASLAVADLTSGRVTYAGASGELVDDDGLKYSVNALTVGDGSGSGALVVDGSAAGTTGLYIRDAGVNRWQFVKAGATAVLDLRAYDAAGVYIDDVFQVANAAGGNFTINRPVSLGSNTLSAGATTVSAITMNGANGIVQNLGATSFMEVRGGSAANRGAYSLWYGPSHATLANNAYLRADSIFLQSQSGGAGAVTIAGTLSAGAITSSATIKPNSYTVATLPAAGTAGRMAYASDGRKNGEGAGLGTGVQVFDDGSNWIAVDTGATVAA